MYETLSLQTDPDDDNDMSGVTSIEDDSTHITVEDEDAEQMRLAIAVTTNAVALGPPCSNASNFGDVRSYIEMATAPSRENTTPAAATASPEAMTLAEVETEPPRHFVPLVTSTPTTVALGTRTPTSVSSAAPSVTPSARTTAMSGSRATARRSLLSSSFEPEESNTSQLSATPTTR
jgi:hypothetical protein